MRKLATAVIGTAMMCGSAIAADAAPGATPHAIQAEIQAQTAATQAAPTPSPQAVVYKRYKNCTALNKVYRHGVGRKGAVDRTSGTRVRNYYTNTRLYRLNERSDRDRDGIACEKR